MTDNYASEDDTEELMRVSALPEPLRLAAMLEKTMQWPLHDRAAACLREMYAALQLYEAQPQQEPVAWWHQKSHTFTSGSLVSNFTEWKPLYTSPPQHSCKFPLCQNEQYQQALAEQITQELYTGTTQRKPLTDEELVEAVREADLDWQVGWTLDEHEPNRFTTLTRAIEAAHGIKE